MSERTENISKLVYTRKERCRRCYTCVRECPAKAIRIESGQAEVIQERCIACGNCVKVCSQDAKVFRRDTEAVDELLSSRESVAAIIAPSFPAEFMSLPRHQTFVGMVRELGFDYVNEVAFGADLIAHKFKELMENKSQNKYISADCPAIVSFIERYHPHLVQFMAPVISPMVATARVLRKKHGQSLKIVFIGPCIAKKNESDEIDGVMTFRELREMFEHKMITPGNTTAGNFDPPLSGKGAIFPVSRGLIQTVNLDDDIYHGDIIVAEGRQNFQEAIREFESGLIRQEHLELLCCEGCIMGAGMTSSVNRYAKRTFIKNYVKNKLEHSDKKQWKKEMEEYLKLDLSIDFKEDDQRMPLPSREDINKALEKIGKYDPKDHLNCGACGYETCEEHAIAICKELAETEMCLPYTIESLHDSIEQLNESNNKLETTREALKQSEKLASMGQLSAGIAHELNNPLGVVIMYANILLEELGDREELSEDLKLIAEQAGRCKKIVGGLLNFARKNQIKPAAVDAQELAQQAINAVIVPENITTEVICNTTNKQAELDKEQMLQVLSNLCKNAIEAMPKGGKLRIRIEEEQDHIVFFTEDTGEGIPQENLDKIFEPFFTTKGIGKGTGLGLATIYGIAKMHKGQITVHSNNKPEKGATGTTFKVSLPRHTKNESTKSEILKA
ncbi:MAG: [Fe-Fe] hydrogenase large subunit C-terminal domain-containing protein [Bacteroidales bacterium]